MTWIILSLRVLVVLLNIMVGCLVFPAAELDNRERVDDCARERGSCTLATSVRSSSILSTVALGMPKCADSLVHYRQHYGTRDSLGTYPGDNNSAEECGYTSGYRVQNDPTSVK